MHGRVKCETQVHYQVLREVGEFGVLPIRFQCLQINRITQCLEGKDYD